MNRFRVLAENIVIYGLGGVAGKMIPFLMLPVITRLMPDAGYYGLNDLSNTLASAFQAIAVFGMYDAMFRLFFERNEPEYQKQICSTALAITCISSTAVFLFICLFSRTLAVIVFGDSDYRYLVYIAAFSVLAGSTNSIVSAPAKIKNESKVYMAANTVFPLIAYMAAIPLLYQGYYAFALQLSGLMASVIIEIFFLYKNRRWFSLHHVNVKYVMPLLKMAAPLMPSFLIYWIYHSSDRLMIKYFLSAKEVGIYAIGAKCGQVSNLICLAFTGGWSFFAYSTMNEENQVNHYSKLFEFISVIVFCASVLMCAMSYLFYRVLFTDEYLSGYKTAPYLFCAPLLQMMFQIAVNQFMIMKKSWPCVVFLLFGAAVNIALNILLIPQIGIEGAAIATAAGYLAAGVICISVLLKIKKLILTVRFWISALLSVLYFIIWAAVWHVSIAAETTAAAVLIAICIYLYKKEIYQCMIYINQMVREKRNDNYDSDK